MNRNSQKNKLKTLPNQITNEPQHFVFKSTHEDIGSCASPTFASTQKVLANEYQSELFLKENNDFGNTKKNQFDVLIGQNKKLVDKYQKLEDDHKRLNQKFEVCSRNLEGKLEKSVKKMYAKNNCENDDQAVNLILELKAMAEEVKNYKAKNKQVQQQKEQMMKKWNEMEILLQNYKKKNDKLEAESKSKFKDQNKEIEGLKEKYEEKIRRLEYEKEKELKKRNQEFENLQFLKKEIQKKRNQDIKYKEQAKQKIDTLIEEKRSFEESKKDLQIKINYLQKQLNEIKALNDESESMVVGELKEERMKVKNLQKQILNMQRQLQQQKEQVGQRIDEIESLRKEKKQLINIKKKSQKIIEETQDKKKLVIEENQKLKIQYLKWIEGKDKEMHQNQKQIQLLRKSLNELKDWNEELEKQKISLKMDIQIQREKNEKYIQDLDIKNTELKDLMSKVQSLEQDQSRRTDYFDRNKSKALSTKAISQLKMIASTLSQILNLEDFELFSMKIQNKQNQVESVIGEMSYLIEQAADYYDELNDKIRSLCCQVKNKEDIIVTMLKFTPEEKKNRIIQYLNIMENIEEQTADKVYKATCEILEEAEDWKKKISNLFSNLSKAQEQLCSVRKMLRNKDGIKRHQPYPQQNQPYYLRKQNQTQPHYLRKDAIRRKYLQQ